MPGRAVESLWPARQWRATVRGRTLRGMREALITGTLWTIYVSARGTALAISAVQKAT